ncbi:hypothetical protein BT96DRAFT_1051507 [Gymnopus androsaceus JB14]|uniref:Reverse transcriptase zinc-binding domain-containing protein n=1 Tax=Gymnopus androsaceus JB14 TaxID=1447944 RepID=A0A6A4H6R1_9AGAR|nr:hypothetical protein BT96DRAFT_1051507 [Gymnopus androsaceus JB14]
MVGLNWECFNKAKFQKQAKCRCCQKTESMDHILMECKCNGQEIIWNLAKESGRKKDIGEGNLSWATYSPVHSPFQKEQEWLRGLKTLQDPYI